MFALILLDELGDFSGEDQVIAVSESINKLKERAAQEVDPSLYEWTDEDEDFYPYANLLDGEETIFVIRLVDFIFC